MNETESGDDQAPKDTLAVEFSLQDFEFGTTNDHADKNSERIERCGSILSCPMKNRGIVKVDQRQVITDITAHDKALREELNEVLISHLARLISSDIEVKPLERRLGNVKNEIVQLGSTEYKS